MDAIGSIFGVVVGLVWTIAAVSLTDGAPGFIRLFFLLIGVAVVVGSIARAIYSFRNATAENRMSEFDITTNEEEPDPLNQEFGVKRTVAQPGAGTIDARLAQLDSLRTRGAISDTEHAAQRKRILDEL